MVENVALPLYRFTALPLYRFLALPFLFLGGCFAGWSTR
jgi:hypothetical protein